MSRLAVVAAVLLCVVRLAFSEDEPQPLLTILYTAESHAALLPCDCPLQPLGGAARRASLIRSYRARGSVLLLDAGGWAAGGIYDEESDGDPLRDRARSALMAKAMRLMRYDAVAVGPADAPLTGSADLVPGPLLIAQPLELKHADSGLALRIFGWSESGLTVLGNMAAALPAEWKRSFTPAFQIHLSRFGEDSADALAAVTGADIVINAGRKTSQRLSWLAGRATVANFDYQSQRLGVIELFPAKDKTQGKYDIRVRHEPLTASIPDDPEVAELLAPQMDMLRKKGKQRVEIEFWTMPECPGCLAARTDMHKMAKELQGRADLTLHFVVHKDGENWASLHGEQEMAETRVQVLVQKFYPEKIWDWLEWREKNPQAPWESGAKQLGILTARIRGALAQGEADALLAADHDLMQRRRVDGTPSLVIANRLYDGPIARLQVLRVVCGLLDKPHPAVCAEVPACFFDAQCKKRGFIGRCIDAGKPAAACNYSRAALKIPATVIVDKENLHDNHERIMELLISDLPGIEFRVLDVAEPDGRELLAKSGLARLPAYFIDPQARQESAFDESVGRALVENAATKSLVLPAFACGAHRLAARPRIKGRLDLFVSRFSKRGQEALETVIDALQSKQLNTADVTLHDVLYWKEDTPAGKGAGRDKAARELAASGGIAEIEDAARALAVKKLAPEKYWAYLLERGKKRGSSYWDDSLKAVGVDAEKVRKLAETPGGEIQKALQAEADLIQSLDTGGEIVVLAENCEIIPVLSRADLRQLLARLAQRK
jgi:hypothetical protein